MRIDYLLIAAVAALMTWKACGVWYGFEIAAAKRETAAAVEAERQTCQANQKKTQEVSNALQKRLKATDARHADYVSRLLKHEASKSAGAASRHDATAGSNGLPDAGVQLLGLAATCERQTGQLIACQEFVRKERE